MKKTVLIFIFCWFGILSCLGQYWQSRKQIYIETLNHFVELYDSLYTYNIDKTFYFEVEYGLIYNVHRFLDRDLRQNSFNFAV
jgi:hypothetical protein